MKKDLINNLIDSKCFIIHNRTSWTENSSSQSYFLKLFFWLKIWVRLCQMGFDYIRLGWARQGKVIIKNMGEIFTTNYNLLSLTVVLQIA